LAEPDLFCARVEERFLPENSAPLVLLDKLVHAEHVILKVRRRTPGRKTALLPARDPSGYLRMTKVLRRDGFRSSHCRGPIMHSPCTRTAVAVWRGAAGRPIFRA
jgi:hypothetical protein